MGHTRRQVLRILGGGLIVAAGGAGVFLGTRTPHRALEPWQDAGQGYSDPRLEVLSWAILAPNPHNRQPWLVRLDGENGFTLFAEQDRKLPHTDPFDRQITIGLGCFLEQARIAATALGYEAEITPFPDGEPDPILDDRAVARVVLREAAIERDPLFYAIPDRRSCKEPYDMARSISADQLERLLALSTEAVSVSGAVNEAEVSPLRDIGWRSHLVESETPLTYMESVDLMRIGKSEIEANPDGIHLGGPLMDSLSLVGIINREQLADMTSSAYQQGLDMYRAIHENTPAFVWLTTPGNSRVDQLAAGSNWVRLNLTTTMLGLALHPISQSLQEYPEMADLLTEIHERLGVQGEERIQMLGRLGHGPDSPPSPRWPLDTRLTA